MNLDVAGNFKKSPTLWQDLLTFTGENFFSGTPRLKLWPIPTCSVIYTPDGSVCRLMPTTFGVYWWWPCYHDHGIHMDPSWDIYIYVYIFNNNPVAGQTSIPPFKSLRIMAALASITCMAPCPGWDLRLHQNDFRVWVKYISRNLREKKKTHPGNIFNTTYLRAAKNDQILLLFGKTLGESLWFTWFFP